MAHNNFRQFEGGISIKGIYATDPVQGEVGDIYFNTTTKSLKYCFNAAPLTWRDLVIAAGTTAGSVLQWDTGTSSWTENNTIVTGVSTIGGTNDNVPDAVKAASTVFKASDKINVGSTGDGGDISLLAGTSFAGNQGLVYLKGDRLYLDIGHAADPVGGIAGQVYYNTATNAFLYYNGTSWKALGGSGGGLVKVTFHDPISTTMPAADPATFDGAILNALDTVLFTNLANPADNNKIWQANIALGTITWTLTSPFETGSAPALSDQVIISKGNSFAQQAGAYNGTIWSFNNVTRYFTGNDYFEQSGLNTSTLADNTTADLFAIVAINNENIIVDYSVIRNTDKSLGTLQIVCQGTNVSLADTGTDLGIAGVTFSAFISSGILHVQYTTTNTGFAATAKYSLKRWSDAAGGPASVPSYTGGSTGITAAGSNSQVQFNDGGNFGGDAAFTFDKTSGNIGHGGHVTTTLNTAVIADNQATPATLISYSKASYPHTVISFSIDRGGETEVGTILVATNGTDVSISPNSTYTNLGTGVTFNAIISGANVEVQYISDNSGFAGTFKFYNNQWS
jgi:hypothetical protein